MNPISRYLPWFAVGAGILYLGSVLVPTSANDRGMHLDELARIPVVERGRVKPLDTVARNSLMAISGRQEFADDKDELHPAIRWLMDVMTSPLQDGPAAHYRVFRIENDQVLSLLGLEERSRFRYALEEIAPRIDKLSEEANRARKIEPSQQSLYERKLVELAEKLQLYIQLARLETPLLVPPQSPNDEWKSYAVVDAEVQRTALEQLRSDPAVAKMHGQQDLSADEKQKLLAKFQAAMEQARAQQAPAVKALGDILRYYELGEAGRFNKALADYHQYLGNVPESQVDRADFEVFFNQFAPFYQCSVLYVLVFLLAAIAWVGFTEPLNRTAFWLAVLTLVVHTFALIARMYIQGRPPVTNLYSSAVFIGWVCVILGLVLEVLYRNGIGNVLAAAAGAGTLVIAHNLAAGGDTLEMMQAVLDTNFWLATHVTCVNIGYAATFIAGLLGVVFVLRGVLTRSLDPEAFQTLGRMIYGSVCFAIFFSFTGTVLGGLWADYSWGRFWGWDPKENGALIIVLWNALILHARWAGMVKQRGLAVLAVGCNIVTAWSWFGVNMLGVGLHSYGFMSGAVFWLVAFVVSQLGVMALGLLPLRYWQSFAARRPRPRPARQAVAAAR